MTNYVDISQQEFFVLIRCSEAYNSENYADQLSLLKKDFFSWESSASV